MHSEEHNMCFSCSVLIHEELVIMSQAESGVKRAHSSSANIPRCALQHIASGSWRFDKSWGGVAQQKGRRFKPIYRQEGKADHLK